MTPDQLICFAKTCPYDFDGMVRAMTDDDTGFLATGGDLAPDTLVSAYLSGVFPWYDDNPICWWSPDPRCVITPSQFRPSKSLTRTAKKHPWTLTVNHAFTDVIHACAQVRTYAHDTWINDDIKRAYTTLHKLGIAISIEIWESTPHQSALIGGLYGLQIGGVFCGESMFHRQTDASKIAFWGLMALCQEAHIELVDCQLENAHLMSLGAHLLSREEFLDLHHSKIHLNAHALGSKTHHLAVNCLADFWRSF